MGRGNAKRRGALPSWSISTRSPIEPCQALRAQQIFLSRVSWGVGVAHSHESLIDGRREVRGQKVGSCLQSHVFHHLPDGKFSRGDGEKQRFQSVWHINVVTCPVLVLYLSCSFHSSGGLTSMWRLRSSFMKNKAVARVLPSQKGLSWGRNAINFQSAARKISKMFAARKKIITFASVKPWGPYRGSHRQSK